MKRESLVVGINRYPGLRDKTTKLTKHLTTPAKDAEAVAQLLEAYGNFHVRRFPVKGSKDAWEVDPHPAKGWTAKDLEDAITELFYPQGEPPETAVLFFAGHGLRKSGTVSEGFLGTSDVLPERGRWGVSLRWLRELLENSPVRQQVVWLDCCFSGELLNLAEADPGLRGKNRNRCFIAASREFEPAFEEFGGQHGVLSGALLQGLDPTQRPDGLVTNYTLTDFIENQLRSARQRPVGKNWGGEIILTGKKEKINNPALMGRCPYKGLEYFNDNEEDAQFFHGRQKLTEDLLDQVDRGNFLAVLGSSGTGKTSVVRAGLLYQLRQRKHLSGSDEWEIRTFRPGKNPLQSLAATFTDPKLPADEWSQQLAAAQAMVSIGGVGLNDLVSQIDAPRLVLVADQFEEAFTLCENQAERQQFFECLLGAIREPDTKLCVLLVMRADFFSKCAERDYGGLAAQIEEHLVTVTPMSPQELEEAIVAPAKQVGLDIERELITKMIDEVKDAPGSLPLLQYTLTELWKQRELDCLRLSKYTALDGVKGALEQRANEVYHSLSRDEQKVAKRIFLELTHLGEGTEDTRRQVFLEDLVTRQPSKVLVDKVIKKLADEKLVVTGEVKALGEARVAVVEVAHEALIRHWSLLRGWINENRDAIRRQREIEEAARDWRNRGKPKDAAYLLQGTKLNLAEDFVKNQAEMAEIVELSDVGREFVQRSIQHRRNSRIRLTGSVIGVITLLSGATIFANIQRIEAERNATLASLREKAATAKNLLPTNQPLDGLVLAIQATGESQDKLGHILSPVQDSLLTSIQSVREQNRWRRPGSGNAVAISPDGQTIISGSMDNTVRLWNRQGEQVGILRGHQDSVNAVAISPDGQTIVSGGKDNTVRLWNRQGEQIGELRGHQGSVNPVAISPDGEYIVSGSGDNTVRLWNRQGEAIGKLLGHKQLVSAVAISPDGEYIVSGSHDKTLRLWNRQGEAIGELRGHQGPVTAVAVSPNGEYIVSGSHDKTLRLWNRKGEAIGEPLRGHEIWINAVTFSPDGEYIVSGSGEFLSGIDNTVRLWNLNGQTIGEPLRGHELLITDVAVSPDGKMIISTSWDGTVRLWNRNGQPLGEPLHGHRSYVRAVAFSPDGQYIVSGSLDKTLRLWDRKGQLIGEPFSHQDSVNAVAISPDGKTIVSGGADSTLRLWNRQGKQIGEPLRGHKDWVEAVTFSPDGTIIASGSRDGTVRLWNRWGKAIGEPFRGHESSVEALAFSPDGQIIVSGSNDKSLRLWNRKGEIIGEPFRGHESSVKALAFSPDGQIIVSGSSDGTLRLWDRNGQLIGEPLRGQQIPVRVVIISPDGEYIVSGGMDNTLRLWDRNGQPIGEPLHGHQDPVWAAAFSPDGETIVSGSDDKTLRLWRVGWKNWLQMGCNQLQYHPVLVAPETDVAREAGETCQKYVWNHTESAQFLVRQGKALAREGDIEGAVAKFKQAKKLDTTLDLEPEAEAKRIAVPALIEAGKDFAYQGEYHEAVPKFQAALTLDLTLDLEPEAEAKRIAVPALVQKAEYWVKQKTGYGYKKALEAYTEAQKLDPTLEISAQTWTEICLLGSLRGEAAAAYEKAVTLDPEYVGVRGIAKAIAGDKDGAIKDFQAFIELSNNQGANRQIQGYIDVLRAGENPFTDAEIKRLLGE